MNSDYFPIHAHSQFSGMDGMGKVEDMVAKVAELGQPAIALTDHGTLGGSVQLYKAATKAGLAPFIGSEFYLVRDVTDPNTRDNRWHIGMLALDEIGYQALTKLSTLSWQPDHFHRKPLIDLSDLAFLKDEGYHSHIAVTTGCYSSMVVQTLIDRGPAAAKGIVQMLLQWFPKTLYVELQDHGVTWPGTNWFVDGISDNEITLNLYRIATDLGLPVVWGADSHYIEPDEQPVHDLMKDICYFGAGEDMHFSGGPYHLLSAAEAKKAAGNGVMWNDIEAGHSDLLDRHELRLPPLDNFKFNVPALHKSPDKELRRLSAEGLKAKGLDTFPDYYDRLAFELDTVIRMGFSNYFLLVKTHVTDYARDHDIIVNTRGSVNGSLLAFVLGISNVDPILWNTNFERFLSIKRKKAPDIDVDVDFRGREKMIDHLRAVFPTMTQVGTYAQIGFGKKKPQEGGGTDEEKGSVVVQYKSAMKGKDPNFDGNVKKEHWDALKGLADTPVYKSMGTNAAGFILPGEGYPIDKYLPLGRIISSDTQVTQFNKDDVEAMGYVKVDLLGLRALQTLNSTLVAIGKQPNDWDWIPIDDKAACDLVRRGYTAGIFQFEGFTNRRGAMEMKVKSTMDLIIAIALYRPALINGGQKNLYLDNRGKAKANQKRLHPIFDHVLDDTGGVPLYQEQVMEMLQAVKMEFEDYNDLMTAIKASNGFIQGAAETFQRVQPIFYDLCEDAGLDDDDADNAWDAIIGFTEYGFNRAHSTGYGLMAYYGAYLKAHYPLQFMSSLLAVWTGEADKEAEYAADCRRMGYSIVKADINDSDVEWKIDAVRPNSLRKGLASIKGVGDKAAAVIVAERDQNGPYTSISDFVNRTPRRPVSGGRDWGTKGTLVGVCEVLRRANAFRSVGNQ
jgi:DNA polymerase-3 subunit alpha